MDKTKSQKEWVREQIVKNGRISRNQCLRHYITTLAQRISELKKYEGFEFDSHFEDNGSSSGRDYVYVWSNAENKEFKTDFVFSWIDENHQEFPVTISAKDINHAVDVFLLQTPIFMVAVNSDVVDNFGVSHSLEGNPKFKDLKTYSKPKKRSKV